MQLNQLNLRPIFFFEKVPSYPCDLSNFFLFLLFLLLFLVYFYFYFFYLCFFLSDLPTTTTATTTIEKSIWHLQSSVAELARPVVQILYWICFKERPDLVKRELVFSFLSSFSTFSLILFFVFFIFFFLCVCPYFLFDFSRLHLTSDWHMSCVSSDIFTLHKCGLCTT